VLAFLVTGPAGGIGRQPIVVAKGVQG